VTRLNTDMVTLKMTFDLRIDEANEALKNTEFFSENTVAEKRLLDDAYNKLQVQICIYVYIYLYDTYMYSYLYIYIHIYV
jgi:hypothetical protein